VLGIPPREPDNFFCSNLKMTDAQPSSTYSERGILAAVRAISELKVLDYKESISGVWLVLGNNGLGVRSGLVVA
jgi:hypothetical protein